MATSHVEPGAAAANVISIATPVRRLKVSLSLCRTERDFEVWRARFQATRHLVTYDESVELSVLAAVRHYEAANA